MQFLGRPILIALITAAKMGLSAASYAAGQPSLLVFGPEQDLFSRDVVNRPLPVQNKVLSIEANPTEKHTLQIKLGFSSSPLDLQIRFEDEASFSAFQESLNTTTSSEPLRLRIPSASECPASQCPIVTRSSMGKRWKEMKLGPENIQVWPTSLSLKKFLESKLRSQKIKTEGDASELGLALRAIQSIGQSLGQPALDPSAASGTNRAQKQFVEEEGSYPIRVPESPKPQAASHPR